MACPTVSVRMNDMVASRCLPFLLILPLAAQVRFAADKIDIDVDGKPFTTLYFGSDVNKPFMAPLRSASGKIVTRRYPLEKVEGESTDHLHHRGLWFSYDDVNGVKFWENDPTYKDPRTGRIVATKAEWKPASKTLEAVFD